MTIIQSFCRSFSQHYFYWKAKLCSFCGSFPLCKPRPRGAILSHLEKCAMQTPDRDLRRWILPSCQFTYSLRQIMTKHSSVLTKRVCLKFYGSNKKIKSLLALFSCFKFCSVCSYLKLVKWENCCKLIYLYQRKCF